MNSRDWLQGHGIDPDQDMIDDLDASIKKERALAVSEYRYRRRLEKRTRRINQNPIKKPEA